eukprot:4475107-Alexandrium_andersonii.AAC.1
MGRDMKLGNHHVLAPRPLRPCADGGQVAQATVPSTRHLHASNHGQAAGGGSPRPQRHICPTATQVWATTGPGRTAGG